jgi:hypothetical protein
MIMIWTSRRDMAELKMYPPSKKVAVLGAATGAINGVVLFDMKKLRLKYNCGVEVILNRKKMCGAFEFLLFLKGGVPAEITIQFYLLLNRTYDLRAKLTQNLRPRS